MARNLVETYVNLLRKGLMAEDQIPKDIREEVLQKYREGKEHE